MRLQDVLSLASCLLFTQDPLVLHWLGAADHTFVLIAGRLVVSFLLGLVLIPICLGDVEEPRDLLRSLVFLLKQLSYDLVFEFLASLVGVLVVVML
jgi:hypothetical protein